LHNMIIEDERNTDDASDIDYEQIDENTMYKFLTNIPMDSWNSLKGMWTLEIVKLILSYNLTLSSTYGNCMVNLKNY
jgi:hypothetical protein